MEKMITKENGEVLAFAGYQDFEAAADRTAVKIKEGYMEMGYILKIARDTDILRGSGYTGYEEFADKRYGLDKGTVSRYIRIVERFSEGGNSHILKENYKNMGFAKLSIMLHMPDAIAEELMDSLSKTEVEAIREEIEAENAVSDIEVAIEAASTPSPETEEKLTPPEDFFRLPMLGKTIWQLGKEQPELYKKLWNACNELRPSEKFFDLLAPQQDAVYVVRIPGTGRLMLTLSQTNGICVTAVRSQEKERATVMELAEAIRHICPTYGMTPFDAYHEVYGIPMKYESPEEKHSEKEKVAPVQPTKKPAKKEKRKESKVTKAAPPRKTAEKPKPAPASTSEEPIEAKAEEDQLPSQMDVSDYPGVVVEAEYRELPAETEHTGTGTECAESGTGYPENETECAENETECAEVETEHTESRLEASWQQDTTGKVLFRPEALPQDQHIRFVPTRETCADQAEPFTAMNPPTPATEEERTALLQSAWNEARLSSGTVNTLMQSTFLATLTRETADLILQNAGRLITNLSYICGELYQWEPAPSAPNLEAD